MDVSKDNVSVLAVCRGWKGKDNGFVLSSNDKRDGRTNCQRIQPIIHYLSVHTKWTRRKDVIADYSRGSKPLIQI